MESDGELAWAREEDVGSTREFDMYVGRLWNDLWDYCSRLDAVQDRKPAALHVSAGQVVDGLRTAKRKRLACTGPNGARKEDSRCVVGG